MTQVREACKALEQLSLAFAEARAQCDRLGTMLAEIQREVGELETEIEDLKETLSSIRERRS